MNDFFDILLALLVTTGLNWLVIARIRRAVPRDEAAFLIKIYAATLFLRYSLGLFLNAYSGGDVAFADTFWGDSSTYDFGGDLLAQSWQGAPVLNPYTQIVSGYGFVYFVGAIYYVFGRNQILVQFVNGTLGAVTVLVIYAIARNLFDAAVARWAAKFMAFFPQMIFWSGAMYKDTAIMLCISLCMYAVLRLREQFATRYVMIYVTAAMALMTLRFYVFYFVAFATLGTFLFSQRRGLFERVVAQLALLGVFFTAFSFAAGSESFERHASYFDLRSVAVVRQDQGNLGQSRFGSQLDVSTTGGAWATLPVGLVYLLFAPFPWAITGLRQVLTLPETLVWYALMPAFFRGLVYTMRNRLLASLPILVFAGALTVAYALFQGNIGTAYRQRTQITMFFFVFMGVGLVERDKKRQRLRALAGYPPQRR